MKKTILLILVLLLAVTSVSAAYTAELNEVQGRVQPGGIAVYELEVENIGSITEYITIEADPFIGLITSDFEKVSFSEDYLILEPHTTKVVTIDFYLKGDVDTGRYYQTKLKTKSMISQESERYPVTVYIISPDSVIDISVVSPDTISAGGIYNLELTLKNNLKSQLPNLKLYLSSDFFTHEENIQLFGLQERTDTYPIQLDKYAEAGTYDLNVRIYQNDKVLTSKIEQITISENPAISTTEEKTAKFLGYEITIKKTNTGNVIQNEKYTVGLSWFKKMFTSFDPEPVEVGKNLEWQYTVIPGETLELSYHVDYRPLGLALLVLILFIFFIVYWFTRGVTIKKSVYKMRQTEDGRTQLKIMLHIKNNSPKKITDVTVIDLLPHIIHPQAHFGTLRPIKEEKGSRGVRLTWKIHQLVSGEERIITYHVDSKVTVIGQITLPYAFIRYRGDSKKLSSSRSNSVTYNSGMIKVKD